MKSIFFFLSFIISFNFSYAKVVEINKYEQSFEVLSQAELVVFDIDNTLVRPAQTLGSDQWYDERVKVALNEGLTTDLAVDRAISEWIPVQMKTQVQLTENVLPNLIQILIMNGKKVIALTARPIELASASVAQLKSVGISLQGKGPINQDLIIDGQNSSYYHNGVLLVGPKNNKGEILKLFLEKIDYHPKSIVFYDDKVKHVNNLEKILIPSGFQYTGFRYGAMDEWVRSFNPKVGEIQFQEFLKSGRILSDSEAQRLQCSTLLK